MSKIQVTDRGGTHMLATHSYPRLFTRDEFYQLQDMGLFEGERVELIEGEILRKPRMKRPHDRSLTHANMVLVRAFGNRWLVRVQLSLDLDMYNQPEPDFVIVTPEELDACARIPHHVGLVIEVSDTSLHFDRRTKALIYAHNGVAEYWIVNLVDSRLEIHRQPRKRAKKVPYASIVYAGADDLVSPLCDPDVVLRVRDLF